MHGSKLQGPHPLLPIPAQDIKDVLVEWKSAPLQSGSPPETERSRLQALLQPRGGGRSASQKKGCWPGRTSQGPRGATGKSQPQGRTRASFHKHLGRLLKMLVTKPHLSPTKTESRGKELTNLNFNKFFWWFFSAFACGGPNSDLTVPRAVLGRRVPMWWRAYWAEQTQVPYTQSDHKSASRPGSMLTKHPPPPGTCFHVANLLMETEHTRPIRITVLFPVMLPIVNERIVTVVLFNNCCELCSCEWNPESDQIFKHSFKHIEHLDIQGWRKTLDYTGGRVSLKDHLWPLPPSHFSPSPNILSFSNTYNEFVVVLPEEIKYLITHLAKFFCFSRAGPKNDAS